MNKQYRTMSRKDNGKIREINSKEVILAVSMEEIVSGAKAAVEHLAEELGIMLMLAAIEAEAEGIAGKKHTKDLNRKANWWGEQKGYVCYEDKKIPVMKPRLRDKENKEVTLQSYDAFQSMEVVKKVCMGDLISGLTCRKYENVAERFIEGFGIQKSSVSRTYVKATKEEMQKLMERDLKALDICAIFIDGIDFKGQMLVVALGLDTEGRKHILGIWQGATENSEVCANLLDDLERRGLSCDKNYLFVMDGSKSLRKGVAKKFGKRGIVQRCQFHKRRNVKSHLPVEHQNRIDMRMSAAYKMTKYEDAKASLEKTITHLEAINPSAASSLKEGLEETLMVHKLGLSDALRRSLSNTNIIESCFSTTRTLTDKVKRWRDGSMVERWAAVALLEAEKGFRRIKGYKDMPNLLTALKREVAKKDLKNLDAAA